MAWFEGLKSMQDGYVGNIAGIILASMLLAAYVGKNKDKMFEYRTVRLLLITIILYSATEIISYIRMEYPKK